MSGEAERSKLVDGLVGWIDRRTGTAGFFRGAIRKVFPDHWTFLLGEIALFCFVILVLTGTFMSLVYTADGSTVVYHGSYSTLDGTPVSAAYDSVLRLSFDVHAGLLVRQIHHWSAVVFLGAIAIHLTRIFFTGAFRRPREINWLLGIGLLLLALGEGITGYSLPDDLLSGIGLRIIYSVAMSIPFIGPWAASLLFGGAFPTGDILGRLFAVHILLLPLLLLGAVTVHLGIVWIQKHTQYKGGRAREDNVIGYSFIPAAAFKSVGLALLVGAVLVLFAAFVEINPVWIYGPYVPYVATVPAQPDWYVGWLEGLLRTGLPIEPTILGVTIPSVFVPGVVIPGILFGALTIWPWLEAWLTGDHAEHHLLDRLWETPLRTATGSAGIALFLVLTLAGGNDVLSRMFEVPVESLTFLFRILIVVAPVVTWLVVRSLARQAQARHRDEPEPPSVRLRRTELGGFEEFE